MKLKPLLIASPILMLCASALARPLTDSVGVENHDGKKIILHKLDPKDNYYSIARRYNVRPAAIIQYNNNAVLHIGEVIKVPTDLPFLQPSAQGQPRQQAYQNNTAVPQAGQPAAGNTSSDTQQYKVSAGETLYAIARRFNTTVDQITSLNNLKSNNLTPGQILIVKAGNPAPPQPVQPVQQQSTIVAVHPNDTPVMKRDSTNVTGADSTTAERRYPNNKYGLYEKNEKGVATWMDDAGLDPNKKLVLHRTAPIGTVIKITNPMTNRTTFAKVVGRFTENETNKDVIIVMTKNAAESLGALDKRFHVNISYGTPNE